MKPEARKNSKPLSSTQESPSRNNDNDILREATYALHTTQHFWVYKFSPSSASCLGHPALFAFPLYLSYTCLQVALSPTFLPTTFTFYRAQMIFKSYFYKSINSLRTQAAPNSSKANASRANACLIILNTIVYIRYLLR